MMESPGNNTSLDVLSTALLDSASKGFAASLFYVPAVTVLVYDALLTLDEEWSYIWKSKWSIIKCLFLIVRYLALGLLITQTVVNFATVPSTATCSRLKWFEGVGGIILEATADIILIYRVFAFCGRNKYLLACLIILYIGAQTASFSLVGILASDYVEIANPVGQFRSLLGGCIPLRFPFKIISVWIIFLCFQSILFACLLFQIAYKQCGAWRRGVHFSSLYAVFVRDGIWAYFFIVVGLILCVVSAYKAQQFGNAFITWLFTITSICCCRLILNLRSAAYKPSTDLLQEDSTVSLAWKVVSPPIELTFTASRV